MKAPSLETPKIELPVTRSEAAEASSAHSRINIPLNLNNWKDLPADQVEQLQWFHQFILAEGKSWEQTENAIGYDKSTIFRILKGTYEGSWKNIAAAIKKYRADIASLQRLETMRGAIAKVVFAENRVTKRINWILDYTLARARSSLILGEGGIGKTVGAKQWSTDNNHGRSVFVECMPIGGAKGLLRQIAERVGVNKNLNMVQMLEAVTRAFNDTRILILDEIQHHVPQSPKAQPIALEMARRIKDLSGCGLAMFGTIRCDASLKAQPYLYEQIMRRAGKPYYLPDTFEESDILPIITQFFKRPSRQFVDVMIDWSNDREAGRLNYLVDMITFASKIAHDSKKELTEEMVLAGHNLRVKRSHGDERKDGAK